MHEDSETLDIAKEIREKTWREYYEDIMGEFLPPNDTVGSFMDTFSF